MRFFSKDYNEPKEAHLKYGDRVRNQFGRLGTIVDGKYKRCIPPDAIRWWYKIKWDDGEFDTYSGIDDWIVRIEP